MKNQKRAILFALLSVIFWSTVASAFKLALQQLAVIQVLFYASLTSAVILLLIVAVQGKFYLFRQQSRDDLIRSAVMGSLNPFIYYLILFKAYALLPAQEAQSLNWTWPIVLAILNAIFFKHPFTVSSGFALLLSFCGVVLISTKGQFQAINFSSPLGTSLALFSSIFWASYWIMNLKDQRESMIKLSTNFIFGTLYTTAAIMAFDRFELPTLRYLGLAIYIGLFEMGLTFATWFKALDLAENRVVVANFGYLAPFLSLIFIYFIVGEIILLSSIIGLSLIIIGIILQSVVQQKIVSEIQKNE